ncbi:MAG: hypothetical protein GY803_33010 [Chloroflexi bacterium]|nr:hypothetical protein [Chloroflexota bacterium]
MSYTNTFIQVSEDCPTSSGIVPVAKSKRTPIHLIQYELLSQNPYTYDHRELIFEVHVRRSGISQDELSNRRAEIWDDLFQKGHPCLRVSALTKRYGWGAHYDENGKIALYAMEAERYQQIIQAEEDGKTKLLTAFRNKRKSGR